MRNILFVTSALLVGLGSFYTADADSVVETFQGSMLVLAAAVLFGSGAVVDAVDRLHRSLRPPPS